MLRNPDGLMASKERCEKCGKIYRAIWHYGKIGTDEGYPERLCCNG